MTSESKEPHDRAEPARPEPAAAPSATDSFTALFVRRPVLALVFNALMVVAGLAAYFGIEVRELPDVDRPVITVNTTFSGASPETVDDRLSRVIESAVSRVSGLKSISSSSSYGSSRVTLEFVTGTDINVASTDVRNALSRAAGQLPEEAEEPQVVKADADSQPVMRLAITSDTLGMDDLTQLVEDEISDRLAAVQGVADVETYGNAEKVYRIDVDQAALASRGLTFSDLQSALSDVALDVPAGSLSGGKQELVVRAAVDLTDPEAFRRLVVKDRVTLGDVATITVGPEDGSSALRANGRAGIGLGIIRQAQSNTLDISNGVKQVVADLQASLPKGTTLAITSDDAAFIRGSIHEVVNALVLACVIVVVVLYLFLRDWRATIIPAVTLPVALVGTLAAVWLAGFSINILTLLAVVLATGMVVDDAIVVLENIVRRMHEGMSARAAAVIGTRQVFFAVIATTLTLASVFVPLSFLPGQVGGLFKEFGFVLAFSVLLSSIVSLTLCPMLASRMLKGGRDEGEKPSAIGDAFSNLYMRSVRACLGAPAVVIAVSVVFAAFAYVAFTRVPQELTPREDRSMVMLRVQAPEGVSLDYMRDQIRRIEENLLPLRKSGEIANTFSISGQGGSANSGFVVLTLSPWEARTRTQNDIASDISRLTSTIPGVRVTAFQSNSLRIRGAGSGLQVALLGNDRGVLNETATKLVAALDDTGLFEAPRLSNDAARPQITVDIDRDRAASLGVSTSTVSLTLQALLAGYKTGEVHTGGKLYPIRLTAESRPVNDPGDLENVFLRAGDGRVVPLSAIASFEEKSVPPQLTREQQLASVSITAGLKEGVTLGQAVARTNALAESLLPQGVRMIPLSEAATLQENSSGMFTTFGFAILIIFLVLAAQFESGISALVIMTTVPLGLACAAFALVLTGTSLNIYSQIGLVLLVGVMAKNGILIVEFANQLRDHGRSVREAIEEACRLRLRPVMMTMICTILGGVPLVLATGAGAEARVALGWVIVGGLGLAVIVTLYVTPVAYLLLARFSKPHADEERRLSEEMQQASALPVTGGAGI
ncbi:efflux RND transporter permease subunit [Gellertiella hungarica]|uniref:HAE1 family hydrophobic/amphiphilic exporter-1 n=1 Tax=Gellertiella hungarica TaxID=1572859 RepID=A0A7W6J2L5_9HYPH|nr:efflux RND transporter permease subunit [Gellertiella hungarica]MBB4063582.1 HAE1 family hydrophobic/amphiphilic exporter-1 [Gellertiella hungarica]